MLEGRPVSVSVTVAMEGGSMNTEECFRDRKGELDRLVSGLSIIYMSMYL